MAVVGYKNLNKYNKFNFLGGLFGKNSDRRFVRATFGVRFFDVVNAIGGTRNIKERRKEAPWIRLPGEKGGIIEIIPFLLSSLAGLSIFMSIGGIIANNNLKLWVKVALFLPVVVPALLVYAVSFVAAQAIRATITAIGFLTAVALTVTGILPLISLGARFYRAKKGIPALTFDKARSMNYQDNESYTSSLYGATYHEYDDYPDNTFQPIADQYTRFQKPKNYGKSSKQTGKQTTNVPSASQDDIVDLGDGTKFANDF